MTDFPKTLAEYWSLSREERERLFKEFGFGHRTITHDIWFHNKAELNPIDLPLFQMNNEDPK